MPVGASIISGSGLAKSSNALLYEKLVVDNEFCKMAIESLIGSSNDISLEGLIYS